MMSARWIIRLSSLVIVLFVVTVISLAVYRWIDAKNERIAQLSTALASSESTVELQKNLYVQRTHEFTNLMELLRSSKAIEERDREIISSMLTQIEQSKAKILSLDSLVAKWKKAYEGLLETSQTEQPPTSPEGSTRKRVDFKKDFGYIGASGYTLTDPPEGFIKIEQLRPLKLTLAVTKNRDGTWSSYVSSSEDNVAVDVALSGVDLSVIRPKFWSRFWVQGGMTFVGSRSTSLGLTYLSEKWSAGAYCSAGDIDGCGLSFGLRLFR